MTVRRNAAPNPACSVTAAGWVGPAGWARATGLTDLPRTTGFVGDTPGDVLTPRAAVTAGQSYYWSISVKAFDALSSNMLVNYYTAVSGGTFVSNSGPTVPLNLAAGESARFTIGPYTAPATAAAGYLKLNDLDGAADVTAYMVSPDNGVYFDGDTPGASWDGTDGLSASSWITFTDAFTMGRTYGRVATADGPTTSDTFTFGEAFGIGSTGVVDEDITVRESFLITSLEWDEVRGRNRIEAFTFVPTVQRARVSRRPAGGGRWVTVRGGEVPVSGGFMARRVDDYEFPSGVDLEYRIEGLASAAGQADVVVQTATVTRRSVADRPWLKFITAPSLNRQLTVVDWSEIERPSRSSVYQVIGRSDPVVVSDVHGAQRTTLTLATHDVDETDALDAALREGLPCYLQVPQSWPLPSMYVTVGDYRRDKPTHRSRRALWTVPVTEIAAPPASVTAPSLSWADLIALYPTWDALIDDVATWREVAD